MDKRHGLSREIAKDITAPQWIQLFAAGTVTFDDLDDVLVDEKAFASIQAEFNRRGNDIPVDYEHQTEQGTKAPAAGWIKELAWRAGQGIMARVEWTQEAADYLKTKQYRYHSPVYYRDPQSGRVVKIESVALTNLPRTNHIKPIVAKVNTNPQNKEQSKTMNLLEKLKKLFNLGEEAGEAEALAAVEQLAGGEKNAASETTTDPNAGTGEAATDANAALAAAEAAATAATEAAAAIENVLDDLAAEANQPVASKAICKSLGLPANASVGKVVAKIQAANQANAGAKRLAKVEAELAQIKAQGLQTAAEKRVAKALGDGKITPAQKPAMLKYAQTDPAGFDEFVASQPQVVPLHSLPKMAAKAQTGAGEFDEKLGSMMGVSKEDYEKYGKEVR